MATSGTKSKAPSPPAADSLCKTLLSLSKDGWNQPMNNTYKDIKDFSTAKIKTDTDKKKAEKNVKFSAALFIVQSIDESSCKSCLKPGDLQKLLQHFNERENPAQDRNASGIHEGLTSTMPDKERKSPNQSREKLCKTLLSIPRDSWNPSMMHTFKNITDVDKKEAEENLKFSTAVFIVQSISGNSCTSCLKPGELQNLLQYVTEGEKRKIPAQDSHTSVDEGAAMMETRTEKGSDQPESKKTKSEDTGFVPNNAKDLSEKRARELKENEEENQALSKRIQEKDKKIEILEGEKIKLLAEKQMMKNQLDETIADRDSRLKVASELEEKLVRTNSENSELTFKVKELHKEKTKLEEDKVKSEKTIEVLRTEKAALEHNFEKLKKYMEKTSRDNQRNLGDLKEESEKKVRSLNNKLAEVIKERDDLKTRFSKLAGAKLTDQNADIADLSDPNRAMKVSEKFGQMYDDQWTDAFEELKKKKMEGKDAIQLLLHILQECHTFCNKLKEAQIDSLNNVLLHPSQDVTKFANEHRKNVGGLKERPRILSKDEKAVRDLRRQIGVSNTCIEEIKQVFVLETKSWVEGGYDKKHLEACKPYLEKCAEVCWLMVLHDPPLYMKMDASNGDKMDPNFYTVYSTSGDKIDYLVWPPLYNEAGGGLISKGVAECFKTIKKK